MSYTRNAADHGTMRRFPVVSTDSELNDRITRICGKFNPAFVPVFLDSISSALDYVRFELPEFQLIHFSDTAIDALDLMSEINEDPWLHYGGIIGVHSQKDAKQIEEIPRHANIITMIPRAEFVETLFRVLYILSQNRQILFQREIQTDLVGTVSGSFEMDNDPYNARTYASLISNFLFNRNYLDIDMRDRLNVSLFELIMNAIEHGNCGISYDEKTEFIKQHGDILPLIRERCRDPKIGNRLVKILYHIEDERSAFTIEDKGDGFDWRARLNDESVSLESHGYGIRMTRHYIQDLTYNDKGNVASFQVPHQKEANARPQIFADQETLVVGDGEVVFTEGEESDDLCYIVSGKLDVLSGGHLVATLTPDDLFLGEMSFLLGNRRSATVISRGESTLVRVTKNAFVSGIRRQPQYGIFLARLLAHRLSRLNRQVAMWS